MYNLLRINANCIMQYTVVFNVSSLDSDCFECRLGLFRVSCGVLRYLDGGYTSEPGG